MCVVCCSVLIVCGLTRGERWSSAVVVGCVLLAAVRLRLFVVCWLLCAEVVCVVCWLCCLMFGVCCLMVVVWRVLFSVVLVVGQYPLCCLLVNIPCCLLIGVSGLLCVATVFNCVVLVLFFVVLYSLNVCLLVVAWCMMYGVCHA